MQGGSLRTWIVSLTVPHTRKQWSFLGQGNQMSEIVIELWGTDANTVPSLRLLVNSWKDTARSRESYNHLSSCPPGWVIRAL